MISFLNLGNKTLVLLIYGTKRIFKQKIKNSKKKKLSFLQSLLVRATKQK